MTRINKETSKIRDLYNYKWTHFHSAVYGSAKDVFHFKYVLLWHTTKQVNLNWPSFGQISSALHVKLATHIKLLYLLWNLAPISLTYTPP